MKGHIVRFILALALILAVWALAVILKVSGVRTAGVNGPALITGALALACSIPPVGAAILFASRRTIRNAWGHADSSTRRVVVLYLGSDVVVAIVTWAVFALALRG